MRALVRKLEAVVLFGGSFVIAALVVYHRTAVQEYLIHIGWLAYPLAALLMTIVAAAPFSVTDALAVMNGVIFGPWWGSILCAVGLFFAAIVAYGIALRTNRLLDVDQQLARLPAWVRRFRAGSPMFLIMVRLLPGVGGTLATQTAAAYRVPIWTMIWTKLVVAVPICTALAIGGDRVADFVQYRITTPVRAYVVKQRNKIHMPRFPHHTARPQVTPEVPR